MLRGLCKVAKGAKKFNARRISQSIGLTGREGLLEDEAIISAPSMPVISPSYPRGPYTFYNREYMIITYESDPAAIREVLPAPLEPSPDNLVLYEWINMPDSTNGFGSYRESGTVIPCFYNGEPVNYTCQMYLNCEPPIAGGREIWGFPKKLGHPDCQVKMDTMVGTLEYGGHQIAMGTMAYKHHKMDPKVALKSLTKTQTNLKIIPDVDWKPKIAQLVGYNLCDVTLKEAWEGPARLHLIPHANAPAARLPIRRVVGGKHILADITLPGGRVLFDYTKEKIDPAVLPNMGGLTPEKILKTPSMPAISPSYPSGPSRLSNREFLIIRYRTDPEALRRVLPTNLVANEDAEVCVSWMTTQGAGFGEYTKMIVLVPAYHNGQKVDFAVQSYLDNSSPITSGREVFGQPQKYANPTIEVVRDTLTGRLDYGGHEVAYATMSYKHKKMDSDLAADLLAIPQLQLKVIPDVMGNTEIAQLVGLTHTNINVREAWEGPARIDLIPHVNAPLADLPVLEVVKAYNIVADITMPAGRVLYDYLKKTNY